MNLSLNRDAADRDTDKVTRNVNPTRLQSPLLLSASGFKCEDMDTDLSGIMTGPVKF